MPKKITHQSLPFDYERFLVFDGHAIIYRAFHAFPDLTDKAGNPTNAIYGFTRIMLRVLQDFDPKYIAVTFDHKTGKDQRVVQYEGYKAKRPEMPDELKVQIEGVKNMVKAFNIPIFELEGYEADDLIGTLASLVKTNNQSLKDENKVITTVVTGDKDLLQLVEDYQTHVFIPATGKFGVDTEYQRADVFKKLGVYPEQVTDLKGLMGDASDNIPGVAGVGPKTAGKLIDAFKTLEGVYQAIDKLEAGDKDDSGLLKGSLLKKLIEHKDMAILSKKLATIIRDAPIEIKLQDCIAQDYNRDQVIEIFEKYNFNSLLALLPPDEFESSVQEALF